MRAFSSSLSHHISRRRRDGGASCCRRKKKKKKSHHRLCASSSSSSKNHRIWTLCKNDYIVVGSGIGGLTAAAMLSYHDAVVVLESHTSRRCRPYQTREDEDEGRKRTRVCVRHRPIFLCWIDDAERAESAGERAERAGRIVGDGEIRSAGHVSHRKRRSRAGEHMDCRRCATRSKGLAKRRRVRGGAEDQGYV